MRIIFLIGGILLLTFVGKLFLYDNCSHRDKKQAVFVADVLAKISKTFFPSGSP